MATLIYDISRLSTRVLNATPNGIDWIDSLLAGHFLAAADAGGGGAHALLFGVGGPRLFAPGVLPNPVDALDRAWGRSTEDRKAPIPGSIVAALSGGPALPASSSKARAAFRQPARAMRVAQSLARYGLRAGADPRKAAPRGAVYLNASHFPLEWPRHVRWLDSRPDIRPVFFVHDLLPLLQPAYFWNREPQRHAERLALLARRGAAAIVGSQVVEQALRARMEALGRRDLPILAAHPPVAPAFRAPCAPDPRLAASNYFVVCGTIEPRKNHLLLLEVWRGLIATHGARAPRLLIIGKRGWRCDDIVQAIEDPVLRGFVIEASGLSTAAYRALLGQARALLSPSLAEGFGLPVAEALCAGTPAVVSDIAPHREQGGDCAVFLDPRDFGGWSAAIESLAGDAAPGRLAASARAARYIPVAMSGYIVRVEQFLAGLAAETAGI